MSYLSKRDVLLLRIHLPSSNNEDIKQEEEEQSLAYSTHEYTISTYIYKIIDDLKNLYPNINNHNLKKQMGLYHQASQTWMQPNKQLKEYL